MFEAGDVVLDVDESHTRQSNTKRQRGVDLCPSQRRPPLQLSFDGFDHLQHISEQRDTSGDRVEIGSRFGAERSTVAMLIDEIEEADQNHARRPHNSLRERWSEVEQRGDGVDHSDDSERATERNEAVGGKNELVDFTGFFGLACS